MVMLAGILKSSQLSGTRFTVPLTRYMSVKANIDDLIAKTDLKGKRILVRADLNLPLDKKDGRTITDDTRARAVMPTVNRLLEQGAKVILCSHLGRPKGKVNESMCLTSVAERLSELFQQNVELCNDCVGPEVESKVAALEEGKIMLLENLRFHAEEEKNDPDFSQQLASLADIYVNDAFGTAHRAHASTEGVTRFVSGGSVSGYLMDKELRFLAGAVDAPVKPMAAIVGGAKVSTKIPVLSSLMKKCDKILVGGGMIFTFYRAQGLSVGDSMVEEEQIELAGQLMQQASSMGVQLILPSDVVIADRFDADAESRTVSVNDIPAGWMGLDIGPDTINTFKSELSTCETIIWNGPMGVFEFPRFAAGTFQTAQTLAECTDRGAITIIGGGDSVAAVKAAGLDERMSHISTGGGASLELLEGKVLPGVAALDDK